MSRYGESTRTGIFLRQPQSPRRRSEANQTRPQTMRPELAAIMKKGAMCGVSLPSVSELGPPFSIWGLLIPRTGRGAEEGCNAGLSIVLRRWDSVLPPVTVSADTSLRKICARQLMSPDWCRTPGWAGNTAITPAR